jgi:hypothetical protein
MPGSGTKLSSRKMTSAPSVNQSRFLRSLALAKFARLKLDAICSAAVAIGLVVLRMRAAADDRMASRRLI